MPSDQNNIYLYFQPTDGTDLFATEHPPKQGIPYIQIKQKYNGKNPIGSDKAEVEMYFSSTPYKEDEEVGYIAKILQQKRIPYNDTTDAQSAIFKQLVLEANNTNDDLPAWFVGATGLNSSLNNANDNQKKQVTYTTLNKAQAHLLAQTPEKNTPAAALTTQAKGGRSTTADDNQIFLAFMKFILPQNADQISLDSEPINDISKKLIAEENCTEEALSQAFQTKKISVEGAHINAVVNAIKEEHPANYTGASLFDAIKYQQQIYEELTKN